ncbi:MAG TPA: CopG family antitoxin [Armatimonadota bacterium]|jgi:predicted DNA binding CopG/RHH family protein
MKKLPQFKTEEEEMNFWDTHDDEEYLYEPLEMGTMHFRPEPKKQISLRLEPSLIAELKQVAAENHVPYQTLTRGLIRRSLEQMRRKSA